MAFMRRKGKGGDQEGPPEMDMLSFASIMTIMLAFFIMLSSFIKNQDRELLMRARESFRKALSSFGLSAILEGTAGRNLINLDIERFRENFPEKEIDNINLEDDEGKNLIEEDIDFDHIYDTPQTYIPTLIRFNARDYRLTPENKRLLDDFILLVKDRPSKIIIEGRVGPEEMSGRDDFLDWYLSSYRAQSVAEYLHVNGGIDVRRLSIIGYGKHRPLIKKGRGTGENAFVSLIILKES